MTREQRSSHGLRNARMQRAQIPTLKIWSMCCGLFGVQIVWGLQNANTSRIFQTLGANIGELAILWIAAPASGLILQPIIGRLSDRTWGRLGRRRPYLFYGAILAAAALLLMPNAGVLWVASLMLWLLCGSINVAMEPFRALIADSLPDEQRTTGFAIQVFFIGTGAVFASALPWILANWFGVSEAAAPGVLPQAVRTAFYIGALFLLITMSWTVATTRERAPQEIVSQSEGEGDRLALNPSTAPLLLRNGAIWSLAALLTCIVAFAAALAREIYLLAGLALIYGLAQIAAGWRRSRDIELGPLEIVEDILHMPRLLRRLAVVQFFTWFALFTMWIYMTPAVTEAFFHTRDPASLAYNKGADWVGVLFAGYNGVAAIAAFLVPLCCNRIGRPATHALFLALGAAGFFAFLIVADARLLWAPMISIGIAWASILSIPYALVAGAVPAQKMGVYMGIHNLFLVIPQLAAAVILGPLVQHLFAGRSVLALAFAGGCLLVAALSTLFIRERNVNAKFA